MIPGGDPFEKPRLPAMAVVELQDEDLSNGRSIAANRSTILNTFGSHVPPLKIKCSLITGNRIPSSSNKPRSPFPESQPPSWFAARPAQRVRSAVFAKVGERTIKNNLS